MFKRITDHYIVKRKGNQLSIHHCPFWFFYVVTKKRFFQKRREAYQRIARYLQQQKGTFWIGITDIVADSFVIDYSRETDILEKRPTTVIQKILDTVLCAANFRNWIRPRIIFRAWRMQEIHVLSISREHFIKKYGG